MTDSVATISLDRKMFRQRLPLNFSFASVPVVAWLFLIVILPNLLLIGTSFLKSSAGVIVFEPSLTNYARIWNSAGFWALLWRTLSYSFIACVFATVIAYPLAFYVGRVVGRNKALLTMLI